MEESEVRRMVMSVVEERGGMPLSDAFTVNTKPLWKKHTMRKLK